MYAITGYYPKLDDRPNTEIIYSGNLEEVKKMYKELTKEKIDVQGIGMLGVSTEYISELRGICIIEYKDVRVEK